MPGAGAGGGSGRGGEGQQPRGGGAAGAVRAMESGGALNGSAAAGSLAAAGTAALGALMALLIAVTVAGNALVMLAFVADSSLRTQNNFFLLNLAISDFLVGKVPPAGRRHRHGPAATRRRGGQRARGSGCSSRALPPLRPRSCPRHPPAAPGPLPLSPGRSLRPTRHPRGPRGSRRAEPEPHRERTPPLAGAFCIPLYVPYVLTGRWIFGRSLCKLWLVVDYLLCTSSVFNIVLISYDRFLSVTRAVSPVMAAERDITLLLLYSPDSLQ